MRRRLGPAILGTQSTPRQSAARAFAAEFLAAVNRLGERIGKARWIDGEAVYELAREFGVSSRVVQRRLRNHGIAEVPDSTWPQRAA